MNGSRFSGIVLILIGFVLLLNQFNIYNPARIDAAILICLLAGIVFLRKSLIQPEHNGIVPGVFLTFAGLWLFASKLDYIPLEDALGIGMIFCATSAALIVSFVLRPQKTFHLLFGILAGIFGGLILITYYRYISIWKLEYIIETYWPVILILFGIALVIDKYFPKPKNGH